MILIKLPLKTGCRLENSHNGTNHQKRKRPTFSFWKLAFGPLVVQPSLSGRQVQAGPPSGLEGKEGLPCGRGCWTSLKGEPGDGLGVLHGHSRGSKRISSSRRSQRGTLLEVEAADATHGFKNRMLSHILARLQDCGFTTTRRHLGGPGRRWPGNQLATQRAGKPSETRGQHVGRKSLRLGVKTTNKAGPGNGVGRNPSLQFNFLLLRTDGVLGRYFDPASCIVLLPA